MNNHDIVCFGEVLWDILPSGAVPGGAPMNVAYHAHRHKHAPALVTRIGNDKEGSNLLELFARYGINTRYVQQDAVYATGKVYAHLDGQHEVRYDIVQPSAWDFIEYEDDHAALLQQSAYFVFGSLACRNTTSEQTLFRLLEHAPVKVFDINLRPPHYRQPLLETLLEKADMLKLNETELANIGDWHNAGYTNEAKMQFIARRYHIPVIVTTLGPAGAILYAEGEILHQPGIPVTVADTIGSGDAFLAGFLHTLLNGGPYTSALVQANRLGALIASKRGACPDYVPGETGV